MNEELLPWQVARERYAQYISYFPDKFLTRLRSAITAYIRAEPQIQTGICHTTTTTTNSNNKHNKEHFISNFSDKMPVYQELLALVHAPEPLSLLQRESVQRLLEILIQKKTVNRHSPEIKAYYRPRSQRWASIFHADADDLITLGLAVKRKLHPDVRAKLQVVGRMPKILCLFCATEQEWRAGCLDYLNFRKDVEEEREWLVRPKPTIPDEKLLLKVPEPEHSEPIVPIYKQFKNRRAAATGIRKHYEKLGITGKELDQLIEGFLNQHFPKKRRVTEK